MEKYCFSKKVQSAYESLQHPIAIIQLIDDQMVAIVLSKGFCEMFEYKNLAEAYADLNNNIFKSVNIDEVPKLAGEVFRFTNDEDGGEVIYRIDKKDGSGSRIIRAAGKHVYPEENVHLLHVWYTDESTDINQKIFDLQGSVSSLLRNMPAMTFSKDVNTREYLACNQAFAEYAHKETPEEVVGLTDFEIFDSETAEHFIEDDKKALAMDKPYIFYEDVPDAAGNQRQFQTTKLKFIDETGRECLLGLCQDVTDAMRIKREYDERLAHAHDQANFDALTGIRNKYAYQELEKKMNDLIAKKQQPEFAVTIFDINDLKKVNDTLGHQAGDEFICEACKIICREFGHSPVFRIGGDEFVAVSEGEDYERIDELMEFIEQSNKNASRTGDIVIACGMEKYKNEKEVSEVFAKADKKMYENKKRLKSRN